MYLSPISLNFPGRNEMAEKKKIALVLTGMRNFKH